jgi:heme oxygenase
MQASEYLRHSTKELHHVLDHHPILQKLMSPALTQREYALALSMLGHWYHYMEESFSHLWPENSWLKKAGLIKQDLAVMKHPQIPCNLDISLPVIANHSFALGVYYVCEGATMGGRIIGPRVNITLNRIDVTKFYHCYGEETLHRWSNNKQYIDNNIIDESHINDAIAGAQWAFKSLINILESVENNSNELMYA